jgi:hypothetical protein
MGHLRERKYLITAISGCSGHSKTDDGTQHDRNYEMVLTDSLTFQWA